MEKEGVGELPFIFSEKSCAIAFDTCIWISLTFNEEKHFDPIKKKQGEVSRQIIQDYPKRPTEYLILLDTISSEFKQIISDKLEAYGKLIRQYLDEANYRIKIQKERDLDVVKEYTSKIKKNPHFNLYYHFFEKEYLGFFYLINNEGKRKEFYKRLIESPNEFEDIFY